MRGDFAQMGVDVPQSEEEADVVWVWDINWRSLAAFLACETQWKVLVLGMSGRLKFLGIDYAAARPVFERRSRRSQRRLFGDIQAMELAAMSAFAEPGDE